MSSLPITFTPAGSVASIVPTTTVPQAYPMPAVDGGNLDTQVTVTGGSTAYIGFAPGAAVGPDAPGCLVVNGSTPTLLMNNAGAFAAVAATGKLLAKCNGGPTDIYGSGSAAAQGAAAAAATQFTALVRPGGGTITITRGTAAATTTF